MAGHEKDPSKKHRHDIGDVDHGPVMGEKTTEGIQAILTALIVATGILVLLGLFSAGRGTPEQSFEQTHTSTHP